nr:PE cleavage protein A-like [Aegilops tauschii subsp. strangulata]
MKLWKKNSSAESIGTLRANRRTACGRGGRSWPVKNLAPFVDQVAGLSATGERAGVRCERAPPRLGTTGGRGGGGGGSDIGGAAAVVGRSGGDVLGGGGVREDGWAAVAKLPGGGGKEGGVCAGCRWEEDGMAMCHRLAGQGQE